MSAPGLKNQPLTPHHFAVVTTDLTAAEVFYGEVLGLTVRRRWTTEQGTPRSIWFDLGARAFLAVEIAGNSTQIRDDEAAGHHCVALTIASDQRHEWVTRLKRFGVTIERTSDYSLYFRDPDGALLALSHYPDSLERRAL